MQGGQTLVAPHAACSVCKCGPPENGFACGTPIATVWSSQSCNNAPPCAKGPLTANCSLLKVAATCATGASSLYISVSADATGGSCVPTPQTAMVTPAKWATSFLVCAPEGNPAPCSGGGVCAPAPGPTSSFKLCISQPGDMACPAGPYITKTLINTNFTDTRGCSACACGEPQATCTGGQAMFAADGNCSQGGAGEPVPLTCGSASIPSSSAYYARLTMTPTPMNAMCPESGGLPIGTATATEPMTICCM